MTRKTNTTETTRSTFRWLPKHEEFLVNETMGMNRNEREAAFRAKFPEHDGSQQSIEGKFYNLTRKPSATKNKPGLAQAALEAKIADLEAQLAQARADLDATHTGEYWAQTSGVPSIEEIASLPMDEVRSLADRFGVKKSGGKQAIAERIHEVA